MKVDAQFSAMKDDPMGDLDKREAFLSSIHNETLVRELKFDPYKKPWKSWKQLYDHVSQCYQLDPVPAEAARKGKATTQEQSHDQGEPKKGKNRNKRKGKTPKGDNSEGGPSKKRKLPKGLGITFTDEATEKWYKSNKKCFRCGEPLSNEHRGCTKPPKRAPELPADLAKGWKVK